MGKDALLTSNKSLTLGSGQRLAEIDVVRALVIIQKNRITRWVV